MGGRSPDTAGVARCSINAGIAASKSHPHSPFLSDPNSLANLDQDLPNYAQGQLPIFSLPQEWLWCETWCAADAKSRAKSIDLCNSPLSKEPKLQMAKRVGGEEWERIDAENTFLGENGFVKPAGASEEGGGGGGGKEGEADSERGAEL